LTFGKRADIHSARLGNIQINPYVGPVLSQMWVQ
jgi:hypothetical protein